MKSTTKSLIPHVLTKQPGAPLKKALPTPAKKLKVENTALVNNSDESDNDEVENDFFSIHKPVDIPVDVDLPLDIPQNAETQVKDKCKGIESFFKKEEDVQLEPEYDAQSMEEQAEASSGYIGFEAESSHSNELDEEAVSISQITVSILNEPNSLFQMKDPHSVSITLAYLLVNNLIGDMHVYLTARV